MNRHPLDRFLETMMSIDPNGQILRIDENGNVAEELTVSDFARRIYDMEQNNTIPNEKDISYEDTHSVTFKRMKGVADELAALSGRLYHGCKKYRVPFIARVLVVQAFIRGLMGGD